MALDIFEKLSPALRQQALTWASQGVAQDEIVRRLGPAAFPSLQPAAPSMASALGGGTPVAAPSAAAAAPAARGFLSGIGPLMKGAARASLPVGAVLGGLELGKALEGPIQRTTVGQGITDLVSRQGEMSGVFPSISYFADLFKGPGDTPKPQMNFAEPEAASPSSGLTEILAQLSGGGGGRESFSSSAPAPRGSDFAALRAMAPQYQTPSAPTHGREDQIRNILGGLAAGVSQASEEAPLGNLLLRMGAGMLGGRTGGDQRAVEEMRRYQTSLPEIQNRQAEATFGREMQLEQMKQGQDERMREALVPKAEGGFIRIPELKGDQIKYNIREKSPEGSSALGLAKLQLQMQLAAERQDPATISNVILQSNGAELYSRAMSSALKKYKPLLDAASADPKRQTQLQTQLAISEFKTMEPARFAAVMKEVERQNLSNTVRLR